MVFACCPNADLANGSREFPRFVCGTGHPDARWHPQVEFVSNHCHSSLKNELVIGGFRLLT